MLWESGGMTKRIAWASGKYVNPRETIKEQRPAEEVLDVTLSTNFVLDCPGLRGREKPELYETRESQDMSRNENDSVPWDSPDENWTKWFPTIFFVCEKKVGCHLTNYAININVYLLVFSTVGGPLNPQGQWELRNFFNFIIQFIKNKLKPFDYINHYEVYSSQWFIKSKGFNPFFLKKTIAKEF